MSSAQIGSFYPITGKNVRYRLIGGGFPGGGSPMFQEMAAALRPHRQLELGLQSIALASGKSGIGKTNVVANLAAALARLDRESVIVDADFALSNLDTLLGLTPRWHLGHFLSGEKPLTEVMVEGPGGIRILSAARGIAGASSLPDADPVRLRRAVEGSRVLDELKSFARGLDFVLIDPPAGRSASVGALMGAASRTLVVVDPEPASLMDSYSLIKWLRSVRGSSRIDVLVNAAIEERDALEVYRQLESVVARFLRAPMSFFGWIPYDPNLALAASCQKLVVLEYPESAASLAFRKLARRLSADAVLSWPVAPSSATDSRQVVQ